jgi:hypothetical protein
VPRPAAAMAGYRARCILATKRVNELVDAADEKQPTKTRTRAVQRA